MLTKAVNVAIDSIYAQLKIHEISHALSIKVGGICRICTLPE